ncbi:MAG: hypothetical protein D6714_14225 [Bacteroidetes bacterium]|nr:MAG: hypothetical protein D6714_14225 [Bacteroidota bacterium]
MFQPPEIGHATRFSIRTSEIDNRKAATVPALLRLMHEAAMENVLKIKLSVWDLEPHHISWVLIRKNLIINRLPTLGESVRVVTYPVRFEKFFTLRDYRVYDAHETLIAGATSTWLLMDTQTRRMTRIPSFISNLRDQMPAPENCLPQTDIRWPDFEQTDFAQSFRVGWHDLDFNNHLSNVLYVQWMLEALPDDILQQTMPQKIYLNFKTEARWKEELVAETQQLESKQFLHRLRRPSDEKILAMAYTTWG